MKFANPFNFYIGKEFIVYTIDKNQMTGLA